MKLSPRILVACSALALACPIAGAIPRDASFAAVGPDYVAEAVGKGESEAEAQNAARLAAIDVVMQSLGKDRLFAELFIKNPPVTMTWKNLSSDRGPAGWTVRVRLSVDDESLRLLYNTAYLSTVTTILDQSESGLSAAERLGADARKAETEAQLGRSMSLYWQARDACDTALLLLSPVGDAAVFSTTGKKKAPELREVLEALRLSMEAGYERIRTAERALASDEALSSALSTLSDVEDRVSEAESWANGMVDRVARVEGTPVEELKAFRDELDARRRALSDLRLALGRLEDAIPKGVDMARARLDVARRGIDRTYSYLGKACATVDREIRAPAAVRARRAQSLRWALLHEPTGALSLRLYSPFGLDPTVDDIAFMDTGRFEFSLNAEGAAGEDAGLWIRTALRKDDAVLADLVDGRPSKNVGYSQTIDLGFFNAMLYGVGYTWDWLRDVDGVTVAHRSALRAFLGGMTGGEGNKPFWMLALSYELPYDMDGVELSNILNFGLDGLIRVGSFAEINAGLSSRLRENRYEGGYDTSFRYSIGAGFRLPAPFLWGLEYAGHSAVTLGSSAGRQSSYVRMFVEYSL